MFFDVTLQAFTMDTIPFPDRHHIVLQFQSGIVLPAGPGGQHGVMPVGTIKIPVGYHLAKQFAEEQLLALEGIEPPSGLIVPEGGNAALEQAAQAAEHAQQVEQQIRKGDAPATD